MSTETKIDVCDGKYTVIHDCGANLRALRYGEPWRYMVGDGLVLSMVQEIETLRETPSLETARAAFEDAAYEYYLQRRAEGLLNTAAEGDGSREALFWKAPDGTYGVLMFNAAWWGWQTALGV